MIIIGNDAFNKLLLPCGLEMVDLVPLLYFRCVKCILLVLHGTFLLLQQNNCLRNRAHRE